MDPHRRIYSGTGSYGHGMSSNRLQNKGRFSDSPMSSPQSNYPYALMLPQQQQKFNPVITPSTTSFGYSQKPWAPSKFGQKNSGRSQGPGGPDVRFVQLNWNELVGANQNSVGTSGTSQVILGDNRNSSQPNSYTNQPQGQQFYQTPTKPSYTSQQTYNSGGNQFCQNPNCQDCGGSQNESPIKFSVSVGNHGDGLGAPTYSYTFPQQSQPQESAAVDPCSSGDNFQGSTYTAGSPAENVIAPVSSAAAESSEVHAPSNNEPTAPAEIVVPQLNQSTQDPCGNCSACKFKSTKPSRRTFNGIPSKSNNPAPCPVPTASVAKPKPPMISPSKVSTVRKNSSPSVRVGVTKSVSNHVTKKIGQ